MTQINKHINFWKSKKVFITGHTGFKGSWLCIMLNLFGSKLYGYSLKPLKNSLFNQGKITEIMERSYYENINDNKKLNKIIKKIKPDVVFHLAAQPLVIDAYKNPLETFRSNILGTANLINSLRNISSVKSTIVITTDKVYEKKSISDPFKEEDRLGGDDPYSSSKASAEIVSKSLSESFFKKSKNILSTVRSGNVLGGGDYSNYRLIPDILQSVNKKKKLMIRNLQNIRPYQHVIDPLYGYILLVEKNYRSKRSPKFSSWNFGPNNDGFKTTKYIINKFQKYYNIKYKLQKNYKKYKETKVLKLDNTKAKRLLKWKPKWKIKVTVDKIVEWNSFKKKKKPVREICEKQIEDYLKN